MRNTLDEWSGVMADGVLQGSSKARGPIGSAELGYPRGRGPCPVSPFIALARDLF